MRYDRYQWILIILALVLCAGICHAVFSEDAIPQNAGAQNLRATMKLGKVVQELQKSFPLQKTVRIVVIRKDVQAWTEFGERDEPIYIKDEGNTENEKCLRHEWQHRWDKQNGRVMTEESANKAE
jgi:hypothetical protein